MTISPSITPANCFDRRSDAAVPTSVTPIRLIASRKMISLKLKILIYYCFNIIYLSFLVTVKIPNGYPFLFKTGIYAWSTAGSCVIWIFTCSSSIVRYFFYGMYHIIPQHFHHLWRAVDTFRDQQKLHAVSCISG